MNIGTRCTRNAALEVMTVSEWMKFEIQSGWMKISIPETEIREDNFFLSQNLYEMEKIRVRGG
jgi:hypothetical protein